MTDHRHWLSMDEFSSMAGFSGEIRRVINGQQVKWTNTATDTASGGSHALRYSVRPDKHGNPVIRLDHSVHWPGGVVPESEQAAEGPFLEIKTATRTTDGGRKEIAPVSLKVNGKHYKETTDILEALHFVSAVSIALQDNIADLRQTPLAQRFNSRAAASGREAQAKQRDEMPNIFALAEQTHFKKKLRFPGMYNNGEFKFKHPVPSQEAPVYDRHFLPALLGLEGMGEATESKTETVSFPSPEGGTQGFTFSYTPQKDGSLQVTGTLYHRDAQMNKRETKLYELQFEPVETQKDRLRLTKLDLLADDRFSPPDLTNHKGVARALRALKFVHITARDNKPPHFSKIFDHHDLKPLLRRSKPLTESGKDSRTMFQLYGANKRAAISPREKGIGSNGMAIRTEFLRDGKPVRLNIGVDWGATFLNYDEDGFHSVMPNYGRFLKHPTAPHLESDGDTFFHIIGHEHEDHIRGIVRAIKMGFEIGTLAGNRHSHRTLKRLMTEEKISRERRDEIMANFHVINMSEAMNPADPLQVTTHKYKNAVVEQSTEIIWSEDEQREKYFPILKVSHPEYPEKIYKFHIGPAGHSAHAIMFEVEGILYTGDFRLDQTLPAKLRTDLDWLHARRDAVVHILESTNASRPSPFETTAEKVAENRINHLLNNPGKRILANMIGSNATDMEVFCHMLGQLKESGAEGYGDLDCIIFAGAAVKNKYTDLNITEDLKKEMKKYGIETLMINAKGAQKRLHDDKKTNYAVIMTGTQSEPLSVVDRVKKDTHDSIRIRKNDLWFNLQGVIPVGRNFAFREALNRTLRQDYGCTVVCAQEEQARSLKEERDLNIYVSSHISFADLQKLPDIYKPQDENEEETKPVLALTHGGPEQLEAAQKIFQKQGIETFIPDPQDFYAVNHDSRTVTLAAQTPQEGVASREIRADQREFYKKGKQQNILTRHSDLFSGTVAEEMRRFEENASKTNHRSRTSQRGSNAMYASDMITGNPSYPKIGIKDKNIRLPYLEHHTKAGTLIGMDSETTGRNISEDMPVSASFFATSPDGEVLGDQTVRHALPGYKLMQPGAILVTGDDDPLAHYKKNKRQNKVDLRTYAYYMDRVHHMWPRALAEQRDEKDHPKALFLGYRSDLFDNPITMYMNGMALSQTSSLKPFSTYNNMTLDVSRLYTLFLAILPDQVGHKKDKDGYFIRTLEVAASENGVTYDNGHDDLSDARYALELFLKLKEIDAEIVEQMVMNCDTKNNPMLKNILGENRHPNDQAVLFGYIDRRDRKCRPRIGALVGIETQRSGAQNAVVLDLTRYDIHDLENMDDEELKRLMNEENGPFSVITTGKSPLWFPVEFLQKNRKAYRSALGGLPKNTLLQRANALSNIEPTEESLTTRVLKFYGETKLGRSYQKRSYDPANDNIRLPQQRISSLFHICRPVNRNTNRHYRKAAKLIDSITPGPTELSREFNKRAFWSEAYKNMCAISDETGRRDKYIEDVRMMMAWLVDDIAPTALPKEDRATVNAMKSAYLQRQAYEFEKEIKEIESTPDIFAKLVGDDKGAPERWKKLKAQLMTYLDTMKEQHKFQMTDRKRELVRAQNRHENSLNIS